jgi:hypothetical protein
MLFLVLSSTMASIIVGFLVLFMGDWRKLKVKFAGVSISLLSLFYSMIIMSFLHFRPECTGSAALCYNWELFSISKNIGFLLFYIGVGWDAIKIKDLDRRKQDGGRLA